MLSQKTPWSLRPAKEQVRDWAIANIPESIMQDGIRYAGLPGPEFLFEKKLLTEVPQCYLKSFVGFEIDEKIYSYAPNAFNEMRDLAEPSLRDRAVFVRRLGNIDPYVQTLSCDKNICPNFIWLDYCGVINESRLNSISSVLRMNMDIYLLATFSVGREKDAQKETIREGALSELVADTEIKIEDYSMSTIIERVRCVAATAFAACPNIDVVVQPYFDRTLMLTFMFKKRTQVSRSVMPKVGSIEILPYLRKTEI